MNAPEKSPSVRRWVVIAGAFVVLTSAMTPAYAVPQRAKPPSAKKHALVPAPRGSGSSGMLSIEWTMTSALRP